jgi:acetylornithine deacetylase/succinyl-diaminopimelate desuccinylase-like protein
MEVREYAAAHAAEFAQKLREWPAIPSVSADPARRDDVRRSAQWQADYLRQAGFPEADLADILGAPLVFAAVGLDADRIHAPNEYVDLSRLLRGAEPAACLWEELSSTPAATRKG